MSGVGALLFGCAVASAVLVLRAPTRVERLLARGRQGHLVRLARRAAVERADVLAAAGMPASGETLLAAKLAAAGAGALAGSVLALVLGGPLPIVLGAYVGSILPTLAVERRAARRRRDADRATVDLVERVHALVASGRPLETAVLALTARASGSALVDEILAATARDYTLGAPLHDALGRHALRLGVRPLHDLGGRIERARALGKGSATMVADLRDELREAERRRALAAASRVEGKLTLVLTLCYLPALALLVVVPLFLTLLSALSG